MLSLKLRNSNCLLNFQEKISAKMFYFFIFVGNGLFLHNEMFFVEHDAE